MSLTTEKTQLLTPPTDMQNGNAQFAQMLEEYSYSSPQQGQIIEAQILKIATDTIFMDVGGKRDAILPHSEFSNYRAGLMDDLAHGDTLPVYVLRTPVGDEELLVSIERGLAQRDWLLAEKLLESQETVELRVIGHNKGGVMVEYGRLQGFVPNSHIPGLRRFQDQRTQTSHKDQLAGQPMALKAIEVDQSNRRLVFSAREAEKEKQQEQLLALKPGTVISGHVTNLKPYGAFVDLGFINGLLHISQIAWRHLNHPADELRVGEEIEVIVESIDLEKERISLNRRDLLPNPWELFAESHQVDDLIDGVVTDIKDFGVFVLINNSLQGMLPRSEMNLHGNDAPEAVLQAGDTILARIINLDMENGRLTLSTRRVTVSEELEWMSNRVNTTELPDVDIVNAVETALLEEEE